MRLEAVLEQQDGAVDTRATSRRSLKLAIRSQLPAAGELQVVIHNISRTGLLIEAAEASLAVGDELVLEVPEAGPVASTVVWESGRFFGCKFRNAISQAAVSSALLRAEPRTAPSNDTSAPGLGADLAPQAKLGPELNFSVALGLALLLWGAILGGAYLILG